MYWEVGGRFKREWTYLYLGLLHIVVCQKPTHYCKAIILQLKVDKLKKKKMRLVSQAVERHGWSCLDHREASGSGRRRAKDQHSLQRSPTPTALHFPAPSSHLGALSIRMVAGKQILEDEATQQRKGHTSQKQVWNMPHRDLSEAAAASVREEACFPRSSCLKSCLQFSLSVSSPKLEVSATLRYLPFPPTVA